MTCGEAYKKIVDEWKCGTSKDQIAEHMGASKKYVESIIGWYKHKGDDLFLSTRPYKGHITLPDEEAIWQSIQEHEWREQEAAREMQQMRNTIKEGDVVSATIVEGKGYAKQIYTKTITVTYIGRDYIVGKTDYGVPETIMIHDLWQSRKGNYERDIESI